MHARTSSMGHPDWNVSLSRQRYARFSFRPRMATTRRPSEPCRPPARNGPSNGWVLSPWPNSFIVAIALGARIVRRFPISRFPHFERPGRARILHLQVERLSDRHFRVLPHTIDDRAFVRPIPSIGRLRSFSSRDLARLLIGVQPNLALAEDVSGTGRVLFQKPEGPDRD